MRHEPPLCNEFRAFRQARGWPQQELADRAGISRVEARALKVGRLNPSIATGLSLANTPGYRVEQLFLRRDPSKPQLLSESADSPFWVRPPASAACRYWKAEVRGRLWYYPCEIGVPAAPPHDGGCPQGPPPVRHDESASRCLVLAGCDPAFALLANLFSQRTGFRLPLLPKSRQASLRLLAAGKVHLAGIHLESAVGGENDALTAHETVGPGHSFVHLASWQSGWALPLGTRFRRVSQALQSRQRWVGWEPGATARQCLDEIHPSGLQPRLIANNHRGVILAIQSGLADVGIAPRILCEEGGLGLLEVRREIYGLCVCREDLADPRITALQRILRSAKFRRLLVELTGYDTTRTGQVRHAS